VQDQFERILTTHTGSLPRPDDLAQMVLDRDEGKSVEGLDQRIRRGVADIVRQQRAVGVDVVNDGEQSKISYATYIKDRLTGFEGEPSGLPGGDALLREHPDFAQRFLSQSNGRRSCGIVRPAPVRLPIGTAPPSHATSPTCKPRPRPPAPSRSS
jgi:hypothetical protein